ncbi:hypothetical protein CGMCC3_g14121 [Colletotrichum fructicola]|nr:uncharacterized protein CGMCC3_g14121 [Colletotrichum fructicola]KAE9569804.1 hypothetical protein CGMCC3_g14121 [Colletotrichum fructicola]
MKQAPVTAAPNSSRKRAGSLSYFEIPHKRQKL